MFTPGTNIPKPVIIVVVDGGPDENPHFMKTISVAIHNFKIMNLDALFVCTNAPKHSAFNRVERRMAPLSRELAGLISPMIIVELIWMNKEEPSMLNLRKATLGMLVKHWQQFGMVW